MWVWSNSSQRATWDAERRVRQRSIGHTFVGRGSHDRRWLRPWPVGEEDIRNLQRGGSPAPRSGGRHHDEVLERAPDLAGSHGGDLGVERPWCRAFCARAAHGITRMSTFCRKEMGGEAVPPASVQRDALVRSRR